MSKAQGYCVCAQAPHSLDLGDHERHQFLVVEVRRRPRGRGWQRGTGLHKAAASLCCCHAHYVADLIP